MVGWDAYLEIRRSSDMQSNNYKNSLYKQNHGKSNLRLNLKDFRVLRVHYPARESLS